jgi:hypothetical protein
MGQWGKRGWRGMLTVVAEFGHKVLDVWSGEATEGFKA